VEGVGFHHEDKPGMAPFVLKAIDLDLNSAPEETVDFDSLDIPEPKIDAGLLDRLTEVVGADNAATEPMDRIVHTYGKSMRDLVKLRSGDIPRVPDVVLYPGDEDEVRQLVDASVEADAVLIPFGGGSNIAGSLEAPAGETRTVISLDLGRLNKVLEVDEVSGLARIQAGALGPDIEEQLGRRGWTLGHYPDSFTHSTLGGWVATRSSGMQSDKYGDIAQITRGLR